MVLSIIRQASAKGCTLSTWYVGGELFCYGLEDVVRGPGQPKVFGQTAIPAGTYRVSITYSNRFKRRLPQLFNPKIQFGGRPIDECGIRIHPGNYPGDTEGCLLPGSAIAADRASVLNSRAAFERLFGRMEQAFAANELITLTIR